MKPYFVALAIIALIFTSCDKASDDYQRLLRETGATPQELDRGISLYTDFYIRMKEEIDAGTLSVEEMINASKRAKEVMATIQRDDEMAAIYALTTLRLLDQRGEEAARKFLVERLESFVKADFPTTENSESIRQNIIKYASESDSLSIPQK
jgi:hypothetical protein